MKLGFHPLHLVTSMVTIITFHFGILCVRNLAVVSLCRIVVCQSGNGGFNAEPLQNWPRIRSEIGKN